MPHKYAKIAEALLASRDEMMPIWDFLAKTIMPRKADLLHSLRLSPFKADHSSTAGDALLTLVGAFLTHVTPAGQPWMEYRARTGNTEKHQNWFRNASEVTLTDLAGSNFYAAIHEHDTENALFGTAATLCEEDPDDTFRFTSIPVGTFGIAENIKGRVDKLCREFEFTPQQIVDRWGEKKLPADILTAYTRPQERYSRKFTIWHLTIPRDSYTRPNGSAAIAAKDMPFASVYMVNDGQKTILEEGGYPEFPYFVTRFLRWTDVWGYAPGLKVYNELKREIKLDRNLDTMSDLSVYPRVFIDAEQDGDIDFRPGTATVIDRSIAGLNLPREWGTQGRYDVGMDRLARTQQKIEAAFYKPFLLVVSSNDRQMTATEVIARQSEQVVGISAAFARYIADLETLQERIFAILFRKGRFNTPKGTQPPDIMQPTADGQNFSIKLPGVDYHGRIVQAIQQAQKQSLDYSLQSAASYIQITGDISAMDCVDAAKVVDFIFRSSGAPSEVFRSDEEVQQIRTQRQAQAIAQQQLTAAETNAKNAQAFRS